MTQKNIIILIICLIISGCGKDSISKVQTGENYNRDLSSKYSFVLKKSDALHKKYLTNDEFLLKDPIRFAKHKALDKEAQQYFNEATKNGVNVTTPVYQRMGIESSLKATLISLEYLKSRHPAEINPILILEKEINEIISQILRKSTPTKT